MCSIIGHVQFLDSMMLLTCDAEQANRSRAARDGAFDWQVATDTELPQSGTGWRWNASSKTLDIVHGDDPVVIRF